MYTVTRGFFPMTKSLTVELIFIPLLCDGLRLSFLQGKLENPLKGRWVVRIKTFDSLRPDIFRLMSVEELSTCTGVLCWRCQWKPRHGNVIYLVETTFLNNKTGTISGPSDKTQ